MVFRPNPGRRWKWPFLVWLLAAPLVLGASAWWRAASRAGGHEALIVGLLALALLATAFLAVVAVSLVAWTQRVVIDEEGVSWSVLRRRGRLRWEEIDRQDYYGPHDDLRLALWTRDGRRHRLPFVTRRLYWALAQRLNRFGDDIEAKIDAL